MERENALGSTLSDNLADVRSTEGERQSERARTSEHSNRAPLTTARFIPLSAGGINALLLVFHATRPAVKRCVSTTKGISVVFLWGADDLKPMSGPWP